MISRVLVTGGNGFVGSAMVPFLQGKDLAVVAATRSPESLPEGVVGFSSGQLNAKTDWTDALAGVDAVLHLAGRAHVMGESAKKALAEHRKINVDVSVNLARQAAAAQVQRFVYVSSIKVNGESTTDRPFAADDPVNPTDPYAVSKYEAESALREVLRGSQTTLVIVRPPLVYGPGVKANFLSLLGLVRKSWPLPLANINNRRSMICVTNFCDVLYHAALTPDAAGHTFLVSDADDVSTPRLLRLMALSMKAKSSLFPFPVGLVRLAATLLGKGAAMGRLCGSLQVDISKTQQVLSWHPPLSVEQGIARVSEWYLRSHG